MLEKKYLILPFMNEDKWGQTAYEFYLELKRHLDSPETLGWLMLLASNGETSFYWSNKTLSQHTSASTERSSYHQLFWWSGSAIRKNKAAVVGYMLSHRNSFALPEITFLCSTEESPNMCRAFLGTFDGFTVKLNYFLIILWEIPIKMP